MTITQPSDAAMLAAVTWAKAHGTFVTCETAEEMFRHAEAWCPRPDLIRAAVGEHHVTGAATTYNFILAPAQGELMTPDGFGLAIYIAGIGLLRTVPEALLAIVSHLPDASLAEISEAIATARAGDPGATDRVTVYLETCADVRTAVAEARTRGIEKPVALVIDVQDPVGRQLVGAAKADAVLSARKEAGDRPLVILARPIAALMHPDSELPTTGRDILTREAGRDGYCPVIVVASGGTSYFFMPMGD
jgi:hypothetical protein